MRNTFFDSLYKEAMYDPDIVVLMSDTGATVMQEWRANRPLQCINVGIAEQNQVSVAAGLAMCEFNVFCYAIIPFITSRCHDQIRVNICCQELPVKLVGVGVGFDYSTLGPTHHGVEDIAIMRCLPNLSIFCPSDDNMTKVMAKYLVNYKYPTYVRVDRTGTPLIYSRDIPDMVKGYHRLTKGGSRLAIVATGRMVNTALWVAGEIRGNYVKVIDLFRIKPLPVEGLLTELADCDDIVTLEAHSIVGGMGSAIVEMFSDLNMMKYKRILRLGTPDDHCRVYGSRECLQRYNKIDKDSILKSIKEWMS